MNLIQHFVNGKAYKGSSSKKSKVFNPATGEQESEVILGTKDDLNKTVEIAKKAFEDWSLKPPLHRARVMFKFKELIEKNSDEIAKFKKIFRIPNSDLKQVAAIWKQAAETSDGFEIYAEQLYQTFRRSPQMLEQIILGLFEIGYADHDLSAPELRYIKKVSNIFKLDQQTFNRLRNSRPEFVREDPYKVLGVKKSDSTNDIKKAVVNAKSGQVEIRNDKDGNIGVSIGNKSFSNEKLIMNFNAITDALDKEKSNNTLKGDLIKQAFITSTMGVSYKVKLGKSI